MQLDPLLVIHNDTCDNYVNLPLNVLKELSSNKKIKMPYLFKIESNNLQFFVGVKEFTAIESTVNVPSWIASNLSDDYISLKLVKNFPKAKFIKIEPLSREFFKIPDNDEVLASALSNYCVLQTNTIIEVKLLDNVHKIKILEIKDNDDNIIETGDILNIDINVDFVNNFVEEDKPKILPNLFPTNLFPTNLSPANLFPEQVSEYKGTILSSEIKVVPPTDVRKARTAYYDKLFPIKTDVLIETKLDVQNETKLDLQNETKIDVQNETKIDPANESNKKKRAKKIVKVDETTNKKTKNIEI
jgi:hypothetical protein